VPLYFFNVYNDEITLDEEGAELADVAAAKARASREARALASHSVAEGHFTRHHRIEVTDADRQVLAVVRFDEAVEIRD
jgi:hypothetical protein